MESHKVVVIYYFLAFYKVKVGILLNFDFCYFGSESVQSPILLVTHEDRTVRVY